MSPCSFLAFQVSLENVKKCHNLMGRDDYVHIKQMGPMRLYTNKTQRVEAPDPLRVRGF